MSENQATRSHEFTTHMKNAGKSVIKQWASLIPNEFWVHGRDATREMLLAMRSAVDGAIDVIEPAGEAAPKPAPKKAKSSGKKKIDIEE